MRDGNGEARVLIRGIREDFLDPIEPWFTGELWLACRHLHIMTENYVASLSPRTAP